MSAALVFAMLIVASMPGDRLFWTPKEAAAELGISVSFLYELKAAGKIGYSQRAPGCRVRFTRKHLVDYAEGVDPLRDELSRRRAAGGRR